jgi:Two component regulator propeller
MQSPETGRPPETTGSTARQVTDIEKKILKRKQKYWDCGAMPVICIVCILAGQPYTYAQSAAPIKDTPFYQDYHEAHPLATPAENDVRALAFDAQERLWAATGAGVRYLEAGQWKTPTGAEKLGPIHALHRDGKGTVWVGAWNGLYRATREGVTPTTLHDMPIGAICSLPAANGRPKTLFAGGPQGIWRSDGEQGEQWTPVRGAWQTSIRALLPTTDNRLWIGTASGLYLQELTGPRFLSTRYSRPDVVLSSNINGLTPLPDGEFAIASTGGMDFYRGTRRFRSLTGQNGMPNHQARAMARDGNGRLWIATGMGVARCDQGQWNLRHSRRWLLSDDTRDVVIDKEGTAWIATASGVDAIRRRPMTLAAKADYFLQLLRARHIRPPGLVGPAVLVTPGDVSQSFIEDDDNDGEHTGMYCAIESMRYAVTKDPMARENARAAFHALMVLQQATGTPHFIARSVLPVSMPPRHEGDRTFTPEEIAETHRTEPREKIIDRRWIPSADGKWLWKRDASSDEVDGHLFGYATYYDLAADDKEKKLVADQVDRIVGGIVDHGYVLQDVDGKGTKWGNWSPQSLNHDPNWHEERPGNSVEIISHLGVAYHVTGKAKYREAAQSLVTKHGYDRNMLMTVFDTPAERTHIEDELLSIVYPNLLTHLVLPSLRSIAQTSMQNWHRTAERDGVPLYDFVYNRFAGRQVDLNRAVETLRDWPLDMIEWTVDNSQREDVRKDLTPGREEGMLTRILPRSEMGLCMWDQEPYKAIIGNNGQREDKPGDWLLAYWMGRYYGLLAD